MYRGISFTFISVPGILPVPVCGVREERETGKGMSLETGGRRGGGEREGERERERKRKKRAVGAVRRLRAD